jgi:hypothetical protein
MIFSKNQVQFRIRIHNLELGIRILQQVSDSYRSGSTVLPRVSVCDTIMSQYRYRTGTYGTHRMDFLTSLWPVLRSRIAMLLRLHQNDPRHWLLRAYCLYLVAVTDPSDLCQILIRS